MPDKPRTLSVHQMRKLVNQGQRMSNWMYSVSQFRGCPEDLRSDMKLMLESWDEIRRGDKHLVRIHKSRGE